MLRQRQFNCSKPFCETVKKKKKKSIKEENVASGVLKWNVALYFLTTTECVNCSFNEVTLNANHNSRKYTAEAYTFLIVLICELSAFAKTGMAAQRLGFIF